MKYFEEIMKVIGSITIEIETKTLKLQDLKTEEELYQLTSRITRFLPYEGKTAVEQGISLFRPNVLKLQLVRRKSAMWVTKK